MNFEPEPGFVVISPIETPVESGPIKLSGVGTSLSPAVIEKSGSVRFIPGDVVYFHPASQVPESVLLDGAVIYGVLHESQVRGRGKHETVTRKNMTAERLAQRVTELEQQAKQAEATQKILEN